MMKYACLILAIILLGCQPKSEGKPKMHQESVQIHCVGRHLVSIPSSFDASKTATGILKMEGADAQDPEIDILVQSEITKEKFDAVVQQRRNELNRSESKTVNILKFATRLSDGSTLFRVQEIDDAYFSEMYLLRGTAMVKVRLESYGNSYLKAEEKMRKLSEAIVERDSTGISENYGFCLGPVLLNLNLSQEIASVTFRDKSGLVFGMDIDTFSRDDSVSLLGRMSRDSTILRDLQVRTDVLRARERKVAGMYADEWLGIGYLGNNGSERMLKFALETRRENPGKDNPIITLSLESAQPLEDGTSTTTKLRNEEALRLWDKIVESIKGVGGNSA